MNPLFVQMLGFLGLLMVVVSFQKDKRSFTLVSQLIAALFFVLHFIFLGGMTGAGMNAVSAVRAYVFNLKDKKKWVNKSITMYAMMVLFWIAGIITWEGYFSILPLISVTLECLALWSSNTKIIRWLFLSARPTWLVYDIIVGSYAGIATEAFIISSIVIAIVRFDILKKKV